MVLGLVCGAVFLCDLSCRASPGDLDRSGAKFGRKSSATDPPIFRQIAFRYPAVDDLSK